MRRRANCLALAVGLCFAAAPLAAQNLLQNGTFDTNVAPWQGDSPPSFSPIDALGLPFSGSMRASAADPVLSVGNFLESECIQVSAGTVYVRRYDYRLETTGGITASANAATIWYSDPTCGSFLDISGGVQGKAADGAWHSSPDPDLEHTAPLGARGARLLLALGRSSAGGTAVGHFDNVAFKVLGTCAGLSHVLCLSQNRFQVEAQWRTPSATGHAAVVKLTDDTGYLWFFSPSNVEVVIKVLDACVPFERFWVFAGGLTNVRVDITVTDAKTRRQRIYTSFPGIPFIPLQDTEAFDTCP